MSLNYLLILIQLLKITKTSIVINLGRYLPINKESKNMQLGEFITQQITNVYATEIFLGDPPQSIPGFLKMDKYGFTLTNYECPHKVFYFKEKSNTFSYVTNKKYYNRLDFYDSLSFYSSKYSTTRDIQVKNYTITADNQLMGPQCFHIGMQLLINREEKETNIIDQLHHKKIINSYYYEYKIYDENEIYLIIGLNENYENNNKYKFIKPIIIPYSYVINLKWGLTFQSFNLSNYSLPYNKDIKAEFDINCGCILGNSDFRHYFKNYLADNDIKVEPKRYERDYYVYFFEKNMKNFEIIKNINLQLYHRELNYNFTFNYQDLILEKDNGYYFLIAFEYDFRGYWKLGFPFFKKYHFVFNHDTKMMGFLWPNGCTDSENDNNEHNNNEDNNDNKGNNNIINNDNNTIDYINKTKDNNSSINNTQNNNNNKKEKTIKMDENIKYSFNVIIFIIIGIIIVFSIIFFFGLLLGKKMFGIRKSKVNELVELYDYSAADKKKEIKKDS